MKKLLISEQEKKEILNMYQIGNRKILKEELDYTKPIITSRSAGPNLYNIWGFVSFPVTGSEMEPKEITDAIDNIVKKLESEGYQATGVSVLNVAGGASNYLNGAMKADKTPNANNPVVLQPATNDLSSYPGEKNREKNLGYARARANVMKNALLRKFPPVQGAKISEPAAYIINTGGVIDEKRVRETYPVPGQQATFNAQLLVKKLPKPPISANELFKQTSSQRTVGTETGPDKDYFNICKILTKSTFLQQDRNLPEIGLGPFRANIKKTGPKTWTVSKDGGGEFTRMEWIYIYFYFMNEAKGVHGNGNCTSVEHVTNLPDWVKKIDLEKVSFGAVNAESDAINKERHKNVT